MKNNQDYSNLTQEEKIKKVDSKVEKYIKPDGRIEFEKYCPNDSRGFFKFKKFVEKMRDFCSDLAIDFDIYKEKSSLCNDFFKKIEKHCLELLIKEPYLNADECLKSARLYEKVMILLGIDVSVDEILSASDFLDGTNMEKEDLAQVRKKLGFVVMDEYEDFDEYED